MTQTELTKILDSSQSTVASWERGQNEPSFTTLNRIASALKVPLGRMLAMETEFSKKSVKELDYIIPKVELDQATDQEVARAMRKAQIILRVRDVFSDVGFNDVFSTAEEGNILLPLSHRLYLAYVERIYDRYEAAAADDRASTLASALDDARERLVALRNQLSETLKSA